MKSKVEYQFVDSDTVDLVRQANSLVDTMVWKQCSNQRDGSYLDPVELTDAEAEAYHAALAFLRRAFTKDGRIPMIFPSKVETEDGTSSADDEPQRTDDGAA